MTDFQPVTRKKWLARRSLQRPRRNSERCNEAPCEIDLKKFKERLERLCAQMLNSDYFIQALETIAKCLRSLPADYKIQRIICLGLGPFTRQFQALHQFAFIIAIQRYYGIEAAQYFDPVFNMAEKKILQDLLYTVMTDNCEGKYLAEEPTLFYLPHCPSCLTNNLLWRNWQPQHLENAIIINNSFDSLVSSKPKRLLVKEASYILKVQTHALEQSIEDDYETQNVFNDLSVHIFPQSSLPAATDEFWTPAESPVYEDEVELISATQLSNLAIA